MEAELDNLALKADHSLTEQEKLLFSFTPEELMQKIKLKWAYYGVEEKKNLIKLLKCCFGEDIMGTLEDLEKLEGREEKIINFIEDDKKKISEFSEDPADFEIDKEKKEDEEDIIIKCSLKNMVREFFKDYVVVWHDPNVNLQVNQRYLAQLQRFTEVKTFTEWEKAVTVIQESKTLCHVITSETNGELIVKEINSCQNVSKIYIFCKDQNYHSTWAKKYKKISCIKTQMNEIMDQIQQNLLKWQASSSLNLPAFAVIFNNYNKSQLNNLYRFLKVIPNFKNRSQAKNDFLMLSRAIYSTEASLKSIAEFESKYNQYNKQDILHWYTRSSFLDKVTNNCLRVATSDSIQYCRLPLSDLERAIKEQYQKESKNFSGLVYGGATLSEQEWLRLKANINRDIEIYGFLRASKDENIALALIKHGSSNQVIMTIIIPKGPIEEGQGFAEVEEFSQYPSEEEILFNVRSRFTIVETEEKYSKEFPYRHLILLYGAQGFRRFMSEQNPVQEIIIENRDTILCSRCQTGIQATHSNMFFLSLVNVENQSFSCQNCLPDLLKVSHIPLLCLPTNDADKRYAAKIRGFVLSYHEPEVPMYGYKCYRCQSSKQSFYFKCLQCNEGKEKYCLNCVNTISCIQLKHVIILENIPFGFWCEKMSESELNPLKVQNEIFSENDQLFLQAKMYFESQETRKAIEYCTIFLQRNQNKESDPHTATLYSFMGMLFVRQEKYAKGLEYFLKSLKIFESIYGENHPETAISYHNIGDVYHKQKNYNKALEYSMKGLVIRESIHGENHPTTAASYDQIGLLYESQGQQSNAFEYLFKGMKIRETIFGKHHPSTASSYNNIGIVYQNQGKYMQALEYYLRCVQIRESMYGEVHDEVATSYNKIGSLYYDQGEYTKALEYFLRCLKIHEKIDEEKHPQTAVMTLYNNIGNIYRIQQEYQKALEYYFRCLKSTELVHGSNHPETATSYNNIADVYTMNGEYTKALEYCFLCLKIRESVYGQNHPETASTYNNIGVIYTNQRKYMQALEHFLLCLKIRESVYGQNHPETASSYSDIASIYQDQGEYAEALEYLSKSLKIRETIHGQNHPSTATSYSNIGLIYKDQGEYTKALEYLSRSLKIDETIHGEHHPSTATSYHNIGLVYEDQGEYTKALEYLSKSLKIRETIHGENHPSTATSYSNIGLIYKDQGEYTKALEYYFLCLKIRESVYGQNHPETASSYSDIASIYQDQGEYAEALKYFFLCLKIRESVYGQNHPSTAASYSHIGQVYEDQQEYSRALEYLSKSLKIGESVYGQNHPSTADSYHNIGLVYKAQGGSARALEYLSKSLKIRESVYGENHPSTADSYHNIGLVYEDQQEYSRALEYLSKSLKIRESVYGENHPSTADSYHNIGLVYKAQGGSARALEYLSKSLKIRESVYGENHPSTADSYHNIGLLYKAQGGSARALEYLSKSLKVAESVYGENHPSIATSSHYQQKNAVLRQKLLKGSQSEKNGTINLIEENIKEKSACSGDCTNSEIEENKDDVEKEDEERIEQIEIDKKIKKFIKDNVIFWHDPNVNSSINQRYLDQLREFCDVKTFSEWKKAVADILETKTSCHVVTSGTNGELLVKEIYMNENVKEIYIFCKNKDYHSTWAKKYLKVSCIETQIQDIIDQIEKYFCNR